MSTEKATTTYIKQSANTTMENLGFEQIFANEFGAGFINKEKGVLALTATSDYIPILKFKQLFEMLGDEVKYGEAKFHKFIFDKSALRTFHQPSMKWYFTEWKTEMLQYGVTKHYKILPDLEYFKRAVEAARKPLLAKYPKDVLDQLTIDYFNSVEEALNAN